MARKTLESPILEDEVRIVVTDPIVVPEPEPEPETDPVEDLIEHLKTAPMSEQVDVYLRMRQTIAEREAELKKELEPLQRIVRAAETGMMARLAEQGVKTMRTEAEDGRLGGTVIRSTRDSCSVADATKLREFLREHDAWDLLSDRVTPVAVRAWTKKHGEVPPGINWSTAATISVRKHGEPIPDVANGGD